MSEAMNRLAGGAGLPAELADLERALGGLRPARGAGLDRDRLMFDAGRAAAVRAGRGRMRVWQAACGVLVIACAGMAAGLFRGMGKNDAADAGVAHGAAPTERVATPAPQPVAVTPAHAVTGDTGEDDWAAISLPGLRAGRLSAALSNGPAGGGGAEVPALKKGDGLDALPVWQRRALLKGLES